MTLDNRTQHDILAAGNTGRKIDDQLETLINHQRHSTMTSFSKTKYNGGTSNSTSGISNVGLLPAAAKLQEELRTCNNELLQVAQLIKKYTSRKKELEGQVKLIKSELKLLSERESTLAEFSRNDFAWSQTMWDQLESVFKIKQFRSQQLAVINATMSQIDCLLIMPTGGGKSLCFQLPAILSQGITIVVSPLISLMEDQYQAMKSLSIPTAVFSASASKEEARTISSALSQHSLSDLKLIYVTPEKIAKSKRFLASLEKLYKSGGFSRLVVDEVHCCSIWGHDFRPDYKFLSIMKKQFPKTPILGLTATATPQVIMDVQKILNIDSCLVFKDTFFRPNLVYEVFDCSPNSKTDFLHEILKSRFKPTSSGIVYCLTIKDTEEVANQLREDYGVRAAAYHAQLEPATRKEVQAEWYKNDIQIMVATVAFGMGINKLDVEFVVHYSISKSLENYYQETGRAGRDGREAYCILLFNQADVFRTTQVMVTDKNGQRNAYNMMKYALDRQGCRKKCMSEYFGDAWDDSKDLCNQHCDNCVNSNTKSTNPGSEFARRIRIKPFYDDVLKIMNHATLSEERMTLIKLNDAIYKRGNKKLRMESTKVPDFGKDIFEYIIGKLLLDGYLQEEFHFTPYSTISYIVPGSVDPPNDLFYEVPSARLESINWKSIVRRKYEPDDQKPTTSVKGEVVKQSVSDDSDEDAVLFPKGKTSCNGFMKDRTSEDIEIVNVHKKQTPLSSSSSSKRSNREIQVVDITDESAAEPPRKKFTFKKPN